MKKKTLKKAVKTYLKSDFWTHCGINYTQEREQFVLQVFSKLLGKIKTKKYYLEIISSFLVFRGFEWKMFSGIEIKELHRIWMNVLYWLHPNRISFTATIKGCQKVYWFKVKNRDQFIYLIGENHTFKGNSLDILSEFSKHISCPIDILVEKEYQSYWKVKSNRTYSNIVEFEYPPLDVCTEKGSVPRSNQILEPRFKKYFENCVYPMKGRVKIWAIDIRRTSIFFLVNNPAVAICYSLGYQVLLEKIQNDASYRRWYDSIIDFQKAVYDFPLAGRHLDAYDKKVKELVLQVYKNIPKKAPFPRLSVKKLKEVLREIFETTDKSHLSFVRSVLRFPSVLWQNWREMCLKKLEDDKPNLSSILMSTLHDIYAILRLYRIIEKQKEGIILIFAGSAHTTYISKMMMKDEIFQRLGFLESKGEDNHAYLPIPHLPCSEKTQMMKIFQTKYGPIVKDV